MRIDEVSGVDKGAGEDCLILIRKRHEENIIDKAATALAESVTSIFGDTSLSQSEMTKALNETYAQGEDFLAPLFKVSNRMNRQPPPPSDDIPPLNQKLEEFITTVLTADPTLSRAEALHYLTRSRSGDGAAFGEHHQGTRTKGRNPMNRTETLRTVTKEHGGIVKLCKNISVGNDSLGITEPEFIDLVMEHAKADKWQGETDAKAFERVYGLPEVSRAHKVVTMQKAYSSPVYDYMSLKPMLATTDDTSVSEDTGKAYDQILAIVEEQRRRSPTLTVAQLFDRYMSDPANAAISRRAVTSFPRVV